MYVILIFTSHEPTTMTRHISNLFFIISISSLVSARYLDNDQLVSLTTQSYAVDQLFSSDMGDIEETEQEVTFNKLTESQITFDRMPQPDVDDFQMNQPKVDTPETDNNQLIAPEMENTEEKQQEGNQPMVYLDWERNTELERVRIFKHYIITINGRREKLL